MGSGRAAPRGHRVALRSLAVATTDPDGWTREPDPLLALALRDLAFYERTRNGARRWHYIIEATSLITASGTVVAAGLSAAPLITALVASAALFANGFRQVFNPAERWELAASGWVTLRRAIDRYCLLPEDQRDQAARMQLQDCIEEVGENEIRGWVTHRRKTRGAPGDELED